MTEELFQLPVVRYRDADGKPTCATDFTCGKFCQFYMTKRFGTLELCFFGDGHRLARRVKSEKIGTLIPIPQCPLWRSQDEQYT